jgi:tRNA-specific 2-thiouridylase
VVAVAVSGGVDSAVAAMLLQQQGYRVFGVHMHNWDAADEVGAPACSSAADLADARALCRLLGIELLEVDFVARYWVGVFEGFLAGLSAGRTPNPDLACNSHIKFGALQQFARDRGADLLATGHYARLAWTRGGAAAASGATAAAAAAAASAATSAAATDQPAAAADVPSPPWRAVLLAGADAAKDQSYFLAGLHHSQLRDVLFPVGESCAWPCWRAGVLVCACGSGVSRPCCQHPAPPAPPLQAT